MPSVAFRFAARELRHGVRGLRGFGVFLGCLALGVAAIAGVQSTASSIVTGLRADGREILGGDLALRAVYRDLAPQQRALIERTAAATTHFTEMRTMARLPHDAETGVLVELKAVDGHYPLFGRVEARRDDGTDVPLAQALARTDGGTWGALVDPALVERLDLKEGDALAIGGITIEVRGTIEREPDRAGSGGPFGFWPRVLVSLDALAASELLREGSLVYHQYALRLAEGVRADAVQAEIGGTLRDAGWQVRTFEDAAPQVRRMVERLGTFLSLVGLTALLVGGVGVGNAVRAWLDTRLGVIATLKCIGASRRVVFSTYLSQLTVIAGVGVLAGLAAGALVPLAVGRLLETLLPTPVAVGVWPGVLGLAALFGLLTAVTFSIWPLSRAHETPAVALFRGAGLGARPGRPGHLAAALAGGVALAALAVASAPDRWFAIWFIGGAALTLLAFRAAGWTVVRAARAVHRPGRPAPAFVSSPDAGQRSPRRAGPGNGAGGGKARPAARRPWLGPRLRMAVSNLYRPGNATADIVLSLGLGLTVLVAVALVEGNLRRSIAASLPEDAPAFFFVGVEADRVERFTGTVTGIDGAGRFRSVPFLRGRIVRVKGLDPEQALVRDEHAWLIQGDRGLSYATAPPDNPTVAGSWWPEDYAGPPLLSVEADVMEAFDLALGDTITVNVLGRELTAEIRHVREIEWQGMQLNFALLLSPEPLRRAPHGYIATVSATPEAEARIERTLAREFPQITVVRVREALGRVAELMGGIAAAARSVGAVTLLAGALVLAGAVAAGHRRRTYESVVLKVLGVRRRDVVLIHAAEFALLGIVTGVIAAGAGTVTAWAVTTQVLDQDWVFLPGAAAGAAGFCVLLTLGLGLFGTWRALGEPASPYLRNE